MRDYIQHRLDFFAVASSLLLAFVLFRGILAYPDDIAVLVIGLMFIAFKIGGIISLAQTRIALRKHMLSKVGSLNTVSYSDLINDSKYKPGAK